MKRIALGVGLTAIALFAFHCWSLRFMDGNPEAREFFASPAFAAALFIGFLVSIFVCVISVTALIVYPATPAGRTLEPEDHV